MWIVGLCAGEHKSGEALSGLALAANGTLSPFANPCPQLAEADKGALSIAAGFDPSRSWGEKTRCSQRLDSVKRPVKIVLHSFPVR
jgi:hypothetical protein